MWRRFIEYPQQFCVAFLGENERLVLTCRAEREVTIQEKGQIYEKHFMV